MAVEIIKRDYPLSKWQAWMYKRIPKWIIKEGDPRGSVVRMILVILSFAPLFGLLAFLWAAFII